MKMVKFFSIPSGEHFLYDAMSNRIVTLADTVLDEKTRLERLCEKGIVYNKMFQHIDFPFSIDGYLKKLQGSIPRLTLEITQQCNLRCEYCVYSGNYSHMRSHTNSHMDWNTVKGSIDFYKSHNIDCADADISFYGGEALLEFDLVKAAVEYARGKFTNKPLHMSISSNGVLLTPYVIAWLSKNPDVTVTVTLNGPYQDNYRRLRDGGGSLHLIMDQLRFIKQNYPMVWKYQIILICNITSLAELLSIRQFYLSEVGKLPILISGIVSENGNNAIKKILLKRKHDAQWHNVLKRLYLEKNDPFLHVYYQLDLSGIHRREIFAQETNGVLGCCFPFLSQLFIAADGQFQICEKVCDGFDLGDLSHGWNMRQIKALYHNTVNFFNYGCRECWGQRLCTVCYKDVLGKTGLYHTIPRTTCEEMRANILRNLQLYCEMAYHYPLVFCKYQHK